jgi:hypothetical protein
MWELLYEILKIVLEVLLGILWIPWLSPAPESARVIKKSPFSLHM